MGRIDRTDDLRRAVERVAVYCDSEAIDVLLVAGDLFSEMSRPDNLRETISHLQHVFQKFLLRGGTILALTGNHDNETFCSTLHSVMTMAAPASVEVGDLRPAGRLYLATEPSFLRLRAPAGFDVQFLLMPYPTPPRYLRDVQTQRYGSLEEKNRHLMQAYAERVRQFRAHPQFDPTLPAILSAHIHVQGSNQPALFRISIEESLVFEDRELPSDFTYVALGHIHQAGPVGGKEHVRYSGSIERLDLGEQHDEKSITIFDVDANGITGPIRQLPLETTPMYDVTIFDPANELDALTDIYPEAQRALVRYKLSYDAATDNLHEVLTRLDKIFPRWYQREWREKSKLDEGGITSGPEHAGGGHKSFHDTIMDYLRAELGNHDDSERDAILALAEGLLDTAARPKETT